MADLPLAEMVLAAGALGTAAFGIVDGFKFSLKFASAGFGQIKSSLGLKTYACLERAYGQGFEEILRGHYLKDRTKGDIVRTLRQGVRIGLSPANAEAIAREIGSVVDGKRLKTISGKVEGAKDLSPEEQSILARFELAMDTRIEAALALADNKYSSRMRSSAFLVAFLLAIVAFFSLEDQGLVERKDFVYAVFVGLAAVPLAPIAKDVATALQSAAKGIRAGK